MKMIRLFIVMLFFTATGCKNTVEIKTTNQWEGRYDSVEHFNEGTKDISLEEDESIWVLSSDSLEYILRTK